MLKLFLPLCVLALACAMPMTVFPASNSQSGEFNTTNRTTNYFLLDCITIWIVAWLISVFGGPIYAFLSESVSSFPIESFRVLTIQYEPIK